jgi:hypothetical protein
MVPIKLCSGPCGGLPDFSWIEIFIVVDGMSRDGRVFLRGLIDER